MNDVTFVFLLCTYLSTKPLDCHVFDSGGSLKRKI